jgi:LacI family transcriptional regulator
MDDLRVFCCQNTDCPEYGHRDRGNLTVCARYGPQQRRLLYCRACRARFSERKGTPLFDSRLPEDRATAVLQHLHDGCGVRQTARLVGVNKNTVVRYALQAGRHARPLHDEVVGFSPLDHETPVG